MRAHYRTVWLSDTHLGNKDCKANYLLDFLNNVSIDNLYLVGDIVDMWAMSKQFRWPDTHNKVLHKLMELAQSECNVVYLPGNHDAPLQKYDGLRFGDLVLKRQCVHVTAAGKRFLVLHGDQFDQEVCFGPLHTWIGDKAYDLLLFINRWYNRFRSWRGAPYWSLAGYIKSRINGANKAITRYKLACVNKAKALNLDGVVCGHIHHPEISVIDGISYHNDGDWIENCSALTESEDGQIKLVYWTEHSVSANLYDISHLNKSRGSSAA